MRYDTIVIGAGQSGLATGYHLQQAGRRFLILEAGDAPGGSWPCFYDSLLLNSPAHYSSLPGLAFPGDPDRYPRRDEAVAYLRAYAAHFRLPVATRTRVSKIERTGESFRLMTNRGFYEASSVVAATGFFGGPNLPHMPGQADYQGRLLHSAEYRSPEAFHGQRIVVVGAGNAAVQIGVELARVARVTLATRERLRYLPQRLLGRDIHFWLNLTGLDHTQWLRQETPPVFDTGAYRAAIKAGRPERKPMFTRFTTDGVVWSDGRPEPVDTVIFATGYRPSLTYLAGLGALDEIGRTLQQKGVSTTVPGLYYVGLPRQRSAASATLRGVGIDAKFVVKHLRRYDPIRPREGGVTQPWRAWSSRSSELISLVGLMTFAVKQQLATRRLSAPKLVGEALIRSLVVGVGSLGVGYAAGLYSQN